MRLLILGCSAIKSDHVEPVPVRVRYRGPWWLTLNRTDPDETKAIHTALSAKYGWIGAADPIEDYELVFKTAKDVRRSGRPIGERRAFHNESVAEIMIVASGLYEGYARSLIHDAQALGWLSLDLEIRTIPGSYVNKMVELKKWLNS